MALPTHSQELCFSTDVFLDENFNVDEFVSQCRKRVTIECLREDLESYFRTLKSAMVELINKDYADFVNLSSNLVGMEKAIGNIVLPLEQLKEEVVDIKSSMEAIINATERKLAQRAEIRKKKVTLQRLVSVLESVEKLERLLKISSRPPSSGAVASEIEQLAEREEFASVVMERIASEFNKLQYSVSHTTGHPLVEEVKPRIATITATLQASLEQSLRTGLVGGDRETLTRCLQTYTAINREQAAESMFQNLIVHPYMDKVISVKAVLTRPQGLSEMYSEVLRFIPKHCSLLLEITQHKADQGVSGFDFVVNAVWPEVVSLIDAKASVVFAPGNPDSFHKNYMATMEFVASFESLCPSQLSVKRLRVHPSFTSFMSKWSLPVYFQIRFQDIAGALEGSLSLPLVEAKAESGVPPFKLELFQVLWRCLHQCWSNGVFIPALVHRFWKLTLQLLVRTMTWLEELSVPQDTQLGEKRDTLTVATCLQVIHDCEELASQIHKVYSEVIHSKIPLQVLKNPRCLEDGLEEARDQMQQVAPKYAARIIAEVSQQCIHNLEPAHTIPRLYRRTNREAPQKHSSYVSNILKPLQALSGDLPPGNQNDWNHQIVHSVTSRYFEITSDVLTSVKRTEDSLLKLKRNRKSLVPSSPASGMSDDNKIRLQLALDIKEYSARVHALRLDFMELPSLAKLQEMGEAAKTTALSSPS